jgi:hypothetical protein
LNYLPEYCYTRKINLYAIFDQHNGLTFEQRQTFPFKIVEHILPASLSWKRALVVISASANNEYYLKVASDNHWPQFVMNHGFSTEEFQEWVKINNFFIGQDLERVEYYTSRIPYELRMVLEARNNLPNATLDDVLSSYIATRSQVFRAQQEVFEVNHLKTDTLKKNAIRAVTMMLLGLNVSKEAYKMNNQLMFEEKNILYPVTPLIRDLLESYWGLSLEEDLSVTFRTIFSSPEWKNDTKGRILEKYIIHQIDKDKHFNVQAKQLTASNVWLSNQSFTFQNFITIHFEGNKRPPGSVDWTKSILFVPDSPNYPDVDMLLWDPTKKLLMPVQITILNPLSSHTNEFFAMRNSGNAAEAWKLKSKQAINTIKFLWIGNNDNVSFNKNFEQYVSLLTDLDKTQFPLLQHFKLN